MKPIRIIQTGDFHLDSPFAAGHYSADQAQQRRRDLRETFSAVMDLARSRKAHVLLVTGDVFEHLRVSMHTIRFIRDQWASQPHLQVLVTPGNHDPAVRDSYYHHMNWSPNVHIFRQGTMECLSLPELNLSVHGFGWTTWEQKTSCLKDYRIADDRCFNLLMFHGEVDGPAGSPYCPVSRGEIDKLGCDAAAVGHIHQPKEYSWENRILARYAGSPEPLHFGERGVHGVLWGEVSKEKQHWEVVPLARRVYRTVNLEADCLLSPDRLAGCLVEQGVETSPRLLLRVNVEGPRSPEAAADQEELTYWLNQRCFYAEIRDRSYPDYDLEALTREYEDTVLADFIAEMKDRIQKADPADLPRLRKALHYGLAALAGEGGIWG